VSKNTERLRNHVASYKSLSPHRQNCLDVCGEIEQLDQKITEIHWWCGREDLTTDKVLREIIDVCDRDHDGHAIND